MQLLLHSLMKLWEKTRQLRQHRWLPFFLPVIGTLLYIAITVLLVPSEFGERSDVDSADLDKTTVVDTKRPKATGRTARQNRPGVPIGTAPTPKAAPATP